MADLYRKIKEGLEMKFFLTIPEEVGDKFRAEALKRHGHGNGSLSKAAEEAFKLWIKQEK